MDSKISLEAELKRIKEEREANIKKTIKRMPILILAMFLLIIATFLF